MENETELNDTAQVNTESEASPETPGISKRKKLILIIVCIIIVIGLIVGAGALVAFKIVKLNHPTGIKGADVSKYQGEIDWSVLSESIEFVFIKATEGSSHTDQCYEANRSGALASGLPMGAYHFFSYDSPGATQAENFIKTADLVSGMLPPVMDIEFYGDYYLKPKPAEEAGPEIAAMIDALESEYGTKPIVYCNSTTLRLYSDYFEGCPIWIRDVYKYPVGVKWTFWQYSDTEMLDGYHGEEKYIDMNVFSGTYEELEALKIK